ncbi:MAG: transporter substrate-binding domain-containing protein [bacterium]
MSLLKTGKLVSILAVLMLIFALAGCGSNEAEKADTAKADNVQKIVDKGVLKVGVKNDVPNFGYKNPQTGELEGFEIDLARAIAKDILGDENKVEFTPVTAQTRGPLLDTGELDMVIATFTITEERKKSYNFSDPYYTDGVAIMVKKDAGYNSLKDLDGKTVGVAQSATSKDAIQAAADEMGIKVKFSEYATYPEIKAALISKRVDAFSVDAAILSGYLDNGVVILDDRYNPQDYGVCTKLSNKDLAEKVNTIIGNLDKDGQLNKMKEKWGLK